MARNGQSRAGFPRENAFSPGLMEIQCTRRIIVSRIKDPASPLQEIRGTKVEEGPVEDWFNGTLLFFATNHANYDKITWFLNIIFYLLFDTHGYSNDSTL